MSKNRQQLQEEAESLGIDFSSFETNAQFEDAIAEAKADEQGDDSESVDEGNEGEREVNTDTDTENPQDDQADIEAPMKGKKGKTFVVETTKEVSFTINGVVTSGTKFEFDNEDLANSRKQMLVDRFGESVIK